MANPTFPLRNEMDRQRAIACHEHPRNAVGRGKGELVVEVLGVTAILRLGSTSVPSIAGLGSARWTPSRPKSALEPHTPLKHSHLDWMPLALSSLTSKHESVRFFIFPHWVLGQCGEINSERFLMRLVQARAVA